MWRKDGQKLSVHVACGHKKRHYAQKTRRFSLGYYWAGKFRSSYLFEYVCRIECVVKCRYDKQDEEMNRLTLQMHNPLGRLVGIQFTADDLEDEFYDETDSLDGVYVAEVDGKVVGYISFSNEIREDEWCGRYYMLEHLIVDEKHRRNGYGTKLLEVLLQRVQKEDANVVADTFVKNEGTIEFFKSLGFKPFTTILLLDRKKRLKLNNPHLRGI